MSTVRKAISTLALTALTALTALSPAVLAESLAIEEGAVIKITRDAVLNGTNLSKGTELKIAAVKKDAAGVVARIDLQEVSGEKKVFKAITPESLAALTSTPGGGSSNDRASIFKVAAQIPIVRELSLGG
ncbi:MAG TPA: hypothetical protein VJT73_03705, partial [Polyangiaceae bacterium]|nr:hypothetical protein [Polyangiaceae bacterium]